MTILQLLERLEISRKLQSSLRQIDSENSIQNEIEIKLRDIVYLIDDSLRDNTYDLKMVLEKIKSEIRQ